MPISIEPGNTFDVVLSYYESQPTLVDKPTFTCRAFTAREWPKIAAMRDKAATAESFPDALCEVIEQGLVGWKNFGTEFDTGKLQDLLSIGGLVELADRIVNGQIPSAEEKKRLG